MRVNHILAKIIVVLLLLCPALVQSDEIIYITILDIEQSIVDDILALAVSYNTLVSGEHPSYNSQAYHKGMPNCPNTSSPFYSSSVIPSTSPLGALGESGSSAFNAFIAYKQFNVPAVNNTIEVRLKSVTAFLAFFIDLDEYPLNCIDFSTAKITISKDDTFTYTYIYEAAIDSFTILGINSYFNKAYVLIQATANNIDLSLEANGTTTFYYALSPIADTDYNIQTNAWYVARPGYTTNYVVHASPTVVPIADHKVAGAGVATIARTMYSENSSGGSSASSGDLGNLRLE